VLLDQLSLCDLFSTLAGRQTSADLPFGCKRKLFSEVGIRNHADLAASARMKTGS